MSSRVVQEVSSLALDQVQDRPTDGGGESSTGAGLDGSPPAHRRNKKGDYNLIASSSADDDEDDDDDENDQAEDLESVFRSREVEGDGHLPHSDLPPDSNHSPQSSYSLLRVILHHPLLPDNRYSIGSVKLVDGPFAVKLLKFWILTVVGIGAMYHAIRKVGWEHDPNMKLSDLFLYEGSLIALDVTVFYVVGRLHQQRGVDHLAWIGTALMANLYSSGITNLPFLQHSLTLYEMHCRWPWQLWLFVGLLVPLVVALILWHVHHAVQHRVFVVKLFELIVTVAIFLVPPMTSNYFHFHHWFAGWLIGMHCNFDVWWSRAAMAWCWGLYLNGIAAYGRDPLLTCGYAYWLSTDLRCPYVQCYLEALQRPQNDTSPHPPVQPMIPPDWRNCSADSYHP